MIISVPVKMGRRYIRKIRNRQYKNYTDEELNIAVKLVREKGSSYEKASDKTGIPIKYLWDKKKGNIYKIFVKRHLYENGMTILEFPNNPPGKD